MTPTWSDKLVTLFWPRRQRPDGQAVGPAGGPLGRRERVLPRGRWLYHRFDLAAVPPARRAQVLDLKLQALQPFARSHYWVGWQGGVAQVWTADAAGREDSRLPEVPESVIQAPHDHGLRLVAGLEGCEGQYWADGILQASRWWPQRPTPQQWAAFARGCGQPHPHPPEPAPAQWQRAPWARPVRAGQQALLRHERPALAGAGALLALLMGWQLGAWWQLERAIGQERQQLQQLNQQAARPLAERERALDELARAQRLREQLDHPAALELLAAVVEELPRHAELRAWQHEDGDLRFAVDSSRALDAGTVVRAFEQVDRLDNLIAETDADRNRLELRARVRAPAAARSHGQ